MRSLAVPVIVLLAAGLVAGCGGSQIQRVTPGSAGAPVVSVQALPSGLTLSPGTLNTIAVSPHFGFRVTVRAGPTGGSGGSSSKVTLSLLQMYSTVVKTAIIGPTAAGQSRSVVFPVAQVELATRIALTVNVAPAEGGRATTNPTVYPVVFTLDAGQGAAYDLAGIPDAAIVATAALPSRQVLSSGIENVVVASSDLGFVVTIANVGTGSEQGVTATLRIDQDPSPIVETRAVGAINPGQRRAIVFRDVGPVQFATRTTIEVAISSAPRETRLSNNSVAYPAVFSLG
jgi:hypothetical protein